MGKFSLEYLFVECNVKEHCLGAELKTPVILEGKEYDELFILKVILSKEEEEIMGKNLARTINTNNTKIKVLAFINGQNPFEACECVLETENIQAINKICP